MLHVFSSFFSLLLSLSNTPLGVCVYLPPNTVSPFALWRTRFHFDTHFSCVEPTFVYASPAGRLRLVRQNIFPLRLRLVAAVAAAATAPLLWFRIPETCTILLHSSVFSSPPATGIGARSPPPLRSYGFPLIPTPQTNPVRTEPISLAKQSSSA